MSSLPNSIESRFLDWLGKWSLTLGTSSSDVVLGIGDDAAIVAIRPGEEQVVTTDALADGTDFLSEDHPWEAIGHKSLAVNLSDLAAMGARPVAAFVSLMLPRSGDPLACAKRFYEGMKPLIQSSGVALAGGDTNLWDGRFVVNVTALGAVPAGQAWRRSGARPGDLLFATGAFGGSIHGRHLRPVPRLAEAAWLRRHAKVRAAIDVSDGLSLDAFRLAKASGCGVAIERELVPIHAEARKGPEAAMEHALSDGEDFELLVALSPEDAATIESATPPFPLARIGRFVPEPGLWGVDAQGRTSPLEPRGWMHGVAT